eukprot:gnl/MRDRNA2_/MRDRNA2_35732_c0_seq1.p1 gnl/MRDRNA2_/MRDRNA2_35732_c0~~gnl/MRDRNA2_/MRDRNA2_35732_c0_seq1.p1  ORF type:complete len:480 (-),score=49.24 gnl/MRDRNA2_/MRDRNA2_35732_c0_seq1:1-1440(-)
MPAGPVPTSARYLAEFLGTYILVLTVCCNVLSHNNVWGATSVACVLMATIYSLGAVSGANFSPAVTIALLCSRCISMVDALGYIIVELTAGLAAGFTAKMIFKKAIVLAPANGFTWVEAGVIEILYTCMLCFVVLNVACSRISAVPNQFYGLAIGFVIIAAGYGPGSVSAGPWGAFNPAVAIGVDVPNWDRQLGYGLCFYYVGFEMIGAVIASLLHRIVRPAEYGHGGRQVTMASALISEFLGTFFLVLTVGFNVLTKSPAVAWSIAAALMCMIYALGGVSGAHFNPAVTLAISLSGRGKMSGGPSYAAMYMVAQILGAVVAGLVYSMILHDSFPLGPKSGFAWSAVVAVELIFTFVLTFVVLCVATSVGFQREMFGLAIGACVTVGGVAIGGVSGGSLNPAVSVGIEVAHALRGGSWGNSLAYSAVELAGGALAAGVFRITHSDEFVKGLQAGYLPLNLKKACRSSEHAMHSGYGAAA